jgi:inosine/xanthosine triphosphate pyrophosphatase family protein
MEEKKETIETLLEKLEDRDATLKTYILLLEYEDRKPSFTVGWGGKIRDITALFCGGFDRFMEVAEEEKKGKEHGG